MEASVVTRVVVIGDVHGNARALRAALEVARRQPFDRLVFMGDLLTYGHDVSEVLAMVHDAQHAHAATLLLGNHDQMYLDLANAKRDYVEKLPDWIRHSVDKTLELVDLTAFRDQLQWSDDLYIEDVVFAHAGPFGTGDWTYVTSAEEHRRAAHTLLDRGLRAGVFGHTHRARWYVGDDAAATADVPLETRLDAQSVPLVANAGAIGQPRDQRKRAVILHMTISPAHIEGRYEPVDYDVAGHLAALRAVGLPERTTERLCGFFASPSSG